MRNSERTQCSEVYLNSKKGVKNEFQSGKREKNRGLEEELDSVASFQLGQSSFFCQQLLCFGFSVRTLITLIFSVVAMKSRIFFPVSHTQLMIRCAGAGREQSQTASPSWPMKIFHTIDIMLSIQMGVGWGTGSYLSHSFLRDCILSYMGV